MDGLVTGQGRDAFYLDWGAFNNELDLVGFLSCRGDRHAGFKYLPLEAAW
jgi:hypothetical protein